MSYGLNGVCEPASNHNVSTGGSYNVRHNHQQQQHSPIRSYPNEVHSTFNHLNGKQHDDGDANDLDRPKLLMWGLTKSGKTSLLKLIFEKMTAGDTLKLPETKMIQIHELACGVHVRFQIRDVPGPKSAMASDFDTYAPDSTTIVFIIDVTEDYSDSINLLVSAVRSMYTRGHRVRFEVLIHKIDGLHEADRFEHHSNIQRRVHTMLYECGIKDPLIKFYLTSIYDHSAHDAFSKIVQNQMRQLRALENMLDLVTASTQLDKIFVCDISNKIFLASDTKPIETQLSELCCDVVDVYTDISSIYGKSHSPVLDSMSYCTIELSIGLVLYLKDINPTTALICILKKESKTHEAFMEVNLNILKKNIQELFLGNASTPTAPSGDAVE